MKKNHSPLLFPFLASLIFFTNIDTKAEKIALIGAGPTTKAHFLAPLKALLESKGHTIVEEGMAGGTQEGLEASLSTQIENKTPVILIIDGVGATSQDFTSQVVSEAIDKELPGYGEELRRSLISFPHNLDSLVMAGVVGDQTLIFALPETPAVAKTALHDIILPALPYLNKKLTGARTQKHQKQEEQPFVDTANSVGPFG